MKLSKIEEDRLNMLREYQILDTLPEEHFDDLTRLIAYICKVPIAAISLIDDQRQWYKSKLGFTSSEEPRGITFCNYTILQKDIFIISDTYKDKRFRDNPFVIGDAKIRFYAGAPLFTPNNVALGTLCVLDHKPRQLDDEQIHALSVLARQVVTQLELRRNIYELQKNVEKRQSSEKQLLHYACHDSLTGMPNRTLFVDRLKKEFLKFKENNNYFFAVLFLDLDRFKIVNDSLGHLIGDKLLINTALRIKSCLRNDDTLARLGGDEFVILLKDIKRLQDAIDIANRIQEIISAPFNLDGLEVFTSLSIGIALSDTAYHDSDEILRDADTAMYRAKELGKTGKTRYAVFNAEMHQSAVALMYLENDLRRAIERQEFQLYYQPIVCLESGCLLGFEALIRWEHPTRGLLSPGEFIPVAEENGLIIPIGYWVISEACRQLSLWQSKYKNYNLKISVNLSSHQFSQPDLASEIFNILQENNLDSYYLKIEITETTLMTNADSASTLLNELKKIGIDIYMDDFGTGYSSLSYLHQLPVHTLKIDKSFVNSLQQDNEKAKIVSAILTLAQNFGFKAIAEGIETEQQFMTLLNLKCKYGQGYFFSKPLDRESAEEIFMNLDYRFNLYEALQNSL
ncbi:EAL domain-containing protein [Altericista sp. CCNU0014]|uniref:sensor domain-containing phosphodiesterase n=1 Tax=Altericista sp. CCNU0014 TaxID=3082949 RepID=UPI0038502E40